MQAQRKPVDPAFIAKDKLLDAWAKNEFSDMSIVDIYDDALFDHIDKDLFMKTVRRTMRGSASGFDESADALFDEVNEFTDKFVAKHLERLLEDLGNE